MTIIQPAIWVGVLPNPLDLPVPIHLVYHVTDLFLNVERLQWGSGYAGQVHGGQGFHLRERLYELMLIYLHHLQRDVVGFRQAISQVVDVLRHLYSR